MDLVTQTVLGAAVGEAVLGKKAGNKAILWGAVGGIIPDLDVLVTPFFNEVDGLFVHRGFSHSLIFAFILAPPLGWLIHKLNQKKLDISWFQWSNLIFWAAFTHPFLDYLTTYGTGAFLPFSDYRVEFGTIGIVDVFYTLPILITLLIIMFLRRDSRLRRIMIITIVIGTSVYLLGTIGNKIYMNSVFKESFSKNGIEFKRIKTGPLPLTNFLWMGIAETDSGYYTTLYSNFDSHKPTESIYTPRNEHLLEDIKSNETLQRLITFTKGYYHVGEDEDGLYIADLRFGKAGIHEDAQYIFKFYIRDYDGDIVIEESDKSRTIEENMFSDYLSRVIGI